MLRLLRLSSTFSMLLKPGVALSLTSNGAGRRTRIAKPELVTSYFLLTHRDMQRTPRVFAFLDFVNTEIKTFRVLLAGNYCCSVPR
jgi:hypothetical protein